MIDVTFQYVRYIGAEVAAALIGGGASLVGNLLGGKMSEDSSMKMAKYMNEYNKPANQIKRLREAGLNPAMVYANSMNDISGNMDSQPRPADYSGLGNSLASSASQASLIASQVEKNEAEADLLRSQTSLNASDLKFRDDLNTGQLRFIDAETQKYLKDIDLTNAQIKTLNAEYERLVSEVDEIKAHTDELKASANKMNEEAALAQLRRTLEQMITDSEIAKNSAAISELSAAAYAHTKQGELDSLAADAQKIVNKYVDKNERIKQRSLQYSAQKVQKEVGAVGARTTAQELQNAREQASQGLETFIPFAWLRSTYRAVGQVFGGQGSMVVKPKE